MLRNGSNRKCWYSLISGRREAIAHITFLELNLLPNLCRTDDGLLAQISFSSFNIVFTDSDVSILDRVTWKRISRASFISRITSLSLEFFALTESIYFVSNSVNGVNLLGQDNTCVHAHNIKIKVILKKKNNV